MLWYSSFSCFYSGKFIHSWKFFFKSVLSISKDDEAWFLFYSLPLFLHLWLYFWNQKGEVDSRTVKRLDSSINLEIQALLGWFYTGVTYFFSVQFSSVAQSCPTLCDPMNPSTPGLPVHHQLPEFPQTHVHWVSDAIQLYHPVTPFSSRLQSFLASGSFPMSQFFASAGQTVGVSASASVLPMNIQDWFPLGWTGLISLQSKDSEESSPTPQFKSINSSALNFLYSPTLTSIHDHWKNHSLELPIQKKDGGGFRIILNILFKYFKINLLPLSHFSCVQLCATP